MKTMHFPSRKMVLALPVAGLCLFGCFDDDDDDDGILNGNGNGAASQAIANMRGYTDTNITGTVQFTEDGDSLGVHAVIRGLTPGQAYGIHVHEVGNCAAPELSGPHFIRNEPHGHPVDTAGGNHRGDLPNVEVDSMGVGHVVFKTEDIDLETSEKSIVNRSVVMHARRDDYVTQPDGGSGERIACGVILLTRNGGGTDTTGNGGTDTTGTGGTDTTGTGGTGTGGTGGTGTGGTGFPDYE